MSERVLVALGGNALVRPGRQGTLEEQAATLQGALVGVVELVRLGHRLVVTHGNGPQVGHILIRVEEARGRAYDLPLDVCVAQSQGEMGFLIEQTMGNLLRERGIDRKVAAVLTRVQVAKDDGAPPSKPIGPFLSREQAETLRQQGVCVAEDSARGFRRVVPSPRPQAILEVDAIRGLFEDGVIVIAAGGGGIPVCVEKDGSYRGVEAVVDKDFTSSLLARDLGVTRIVDLTGVNYVKLYFASRSETDLKSMTVTEAKKHLQAGHFLPGSMGPKIEAAIDFLEQGGREVVVTLPELAFEAFQGLAGTHIYPNP
ncbi:MAG: carbamate kinase [Planctomycetia bacterium]|nr:carbamate kinase [Planctomycetia bacterium]